MPAVLRVHRYVRTGGAFLVLGALLFLIGLFSAAADYPSGFPWLTDHVTQLGVAADSPLAVVFNLGLAAFGALVFVGLLLAWSAFPPGIGRVGGLGLLMIASAATVAVALIPGVSAHVGVAQVLFVAGGAGLVLLATTFGPTTAWGSFRLLTLGLGCLVLASYVVLFYTSVGFDQYPGLFGLLAIGPLVLWDLGAGGYLVRSRPRRSPVLANAPKPP